MVSEIHECHARAAIFAFECLVRITADVVRRHFSVPLGSKDQFCNRMALYELACGGK